MKSEIRNRKTRRIVFFVALFFSVGYSDPETFVVRAATYYVDATAGSDSNDGLSSGAAWQTLSKVSGTTFSPSDSILFKRGEIFPGSLDCHNSGSSGNPITYADYGSGAKPIIDGTGEGTAVSCFRNYVTIRNIIEQDALFFGWRIEGSHITLEGVEGNSNPASGLVIDQTSDISDITVSDSAFNDNSQSGIITGNQAPGYVFQRIYFDQVEASGNSQSGINLNVSSDGSLISSWTLSGGTVWYASFSHAPGSGVFFDGASGNEVGSVGAIAAPLDWFWDNGTGRLYAYSSGAPSTTYTQPGIEAPSRFSDVRITDSTFTGNVNASPSDSAGVYMNHDPYPAGDQYSWSDGLLIDGVTVSGNEKNGMLVRGFSSDVIESAVRNSVMTGNNVNPYYEYAGLLLAKNKGLLVEKNQIHANQNKAKGISVLAGENSSVIRYNLIYDNVGTGTATTGQGIGLLDTSQVVVYGNVIRDNKDGISIEGASSAGNKVYNNTVANNTGSQVLYWASAQAASADIRNNILRGGAYGIRVSGATAPASQDYNCVGNSSSAEHSGLSAGVHSLSGCDPLFTDEAHDDLTPYYGSPVIDSGDTLGVSYANSLHYDSVWPGSTVTTSDQNANGSGWEIGAYVHVPPTVPVIINATVTDANDIYPLGDALTVRLTFDQSVTVTATPRVLLETGSTDRYATYSAGSGSTALDFTYVIQTGDTSSHLDYQSSSALDLNGGTIRNGSTDASLVLSEPGARGSIGFNKSIVLDSVIPYVTNVTSSAQNGTYHVGYSLGPIQVVFNEAVTVTGTPRVLLETGSTDRYATYYGGSGTTTLRFSYTVQSGDEFSDLDYASSGAFDLHGGTIIDVAGNAADAILPPPGANGSLGANTSFVVNAADITILGDNDVSPLGTNLENIEYWMRGYPFIDAFKTSTSFWYTQSDSTFDTEEQDKLDVDEYGWVRSLTPIDNQSASYTKVARYLFRGRSGEYPGGQYVVLYDGEGTIQYTEDAVKNAGLSAPGRDVLDVTPTDLGFSVVITSTDPNHTGEYIRNLRVLRASQEQDFLDGEVFNPDFIEATKKYRAIRFMEWMEINGSSQSSWSDRPEEGDVSYSQAGVPIETMLNLANTLHADPWLNVPHLATDDYITRFAEMAHQRLGSDRKVYVEFSNELWNSSFSQNWYSQTVGVARWPSQSATPWVAGWNWYGMKTAQMCDIWKSEWGGDADRIVCVLSGQAAGTTPNEEALACPLWTESGGTCADHGLDAFSAAPYISFDPDTPALDWVSDPDGGLDKLFTELLSGGVIPGGTPGGTLEQSYGWMETNKALADTYGLEYIAYEGGQHLVDEQYRSAIVSLYSEANRDSRMGDVYAAYFQRWKELGGGLFMHYTDTSSYTQYGNFGSRESINETSTPKYDALMAFIDNNTCWWTDCMMHIGTSGPAVTAVSSSATDGTYGEGSVIDITVSFEEIVHVTGMPTLELETGTINRSAVYVSGTGTNTLVFRYTVHAGDSASDLGYVAVGSLHLNGGLVDDALGNAALLTLPVPGESGSLSANKNIAIVTASSQNDGGSSDSPSQDDEDSDAEGDLDISGIKTTSDETTITVSWKTDRKASARVRYGTSTDRLVAKSKDSGRSKEHRMTLDNLVPGTKYYLRIISEDADGNEARRSNITVRTKAHVSSSRRAAVPALSTDDVTTESGQIPLSEAASNVSEQTVSLSKTEPLAMPEAIDGFFTTRLITTNGHKRLAEVKFRIVDPSTGNPIGGLPITLHSDPQDSLTDTHGIVTFHDVELGNHTLLFSHGEEKFKKSVVLGESVSEDGMIRAEIISIRVERDPWSWREWVIVGILSFVSLISVGLLVRRKFL